MKSKYKFLQTPSTPTDPKEISTTIGKLNKLITKLP